MTLLDFINRASTEEYFVAGTYHEAARGAVAQPIEGSGHFLQDGEAFVFEGSYRHHRGATSHRFLVRLPLVHPQSGAVEVSTVHTGPLAGHCLPSGDGLELLAWGGSKGNVLSCRVVVATDGAMTLTGSVKVDDASLAFNVTGYVGSDRSSLGNVVSISSARNA